MYDLTSFTEGMGQIDSVKLYEIEPINNKNQYISCLVSCTLNNYLFKILSEYTINQSNIFESVAIFIRLYYLLLVIRNYIKEKCDNCI